MLDQRFFDRQGTVKTCAILGEAQVGRSGWAGPHMDRHRDIELLDDREIGVERGIARVEALILNRDFTECAIAAALQRVANRVG